MLSADADVYQEKKNLTVKMTGKKFNKGRINKIRVKAVTQEELYQDIINIEEVRDQEKSTSHKGKET